MTVLGTKDDWCIEVPIRLVIEERFAYSERFVDRSGELVIESPCQLRFIHLPPLIHPWCVRGVAVLHIDRVPLERVHRQLCASWDDEQSAP